MSTVYKAVYEDDKPIVHWRTKGSKNGVRQWQNEDGSYTEAGRNSKPGGRYNTDYDPEKARKKAEKAAYKTEKRAIGNGRYAAAKRRQQGLRQAILTPGDLGKAITDTATGKMSLDDYYKKIGGKWMGQLLVVGALSCGAIIGTELLLNQGFGAEVAEQLANTLMKGDLKPDNYAGIVKFDKFSDLFKYAKMKDPDAYMEMKKTHIANTYGFVNMEAMEDASRFASAEYDEQANKAAYKLYKELWNDPDVDPNTSKGPKDYDSWLSDREEKKAIFGPDGKVVDRKHGGVETLQDQIDELNKKIDLQDIMFGFGSYANSK